MRSEVVQRSEVSEETGERWQDVIDRARELGETLVDAAAAMEEGLFHIPIGNLGGFDPDALGSLLADIEELASEVGHGD